MCWAVQTTSYGPTCPVLLSLAFGPAVLNSLLLHPGIAALTSDHKNSYVFMRRCYLLFLMYITAYSFQSVSGEDDDDRQIYWALLFQPCCSMLACNINRKNQLMRWGLASAHFYRRRNWGIERERNLPKAIRRTKNLVLTHCKAAFNTSGFLPFSPPSPHFSFLHLFVVQVFHGDFGKASIRYGPSFFISQNPIWRQISSVIWAERI